MREFTIIVHHADEGGYWVEVPALPGCFSQGETLDEAVQNARDAIESHLESLTDAGGDIPENDDLMIARVAV